LQNRRVFIGSAAQKCRVFICRSFAEVPRLQKCRVFECEGKPKCRAQSKLPRKLPRYALALRYMLIRRAYALPLRYMLTRASPPPLPLSHSALLQSKFTHPPCRNHFGLLFLLVFVQTDTQKIDNAFRSFQKRSCLLTAFYGKIFFKLLKAMPIFLGLPPLLWVPSKCRIFAFRQACALRCVPLTRKDTYSDSIRFAH